MIKKIFTIALTLITLFSYTVTFATCNTFSADLELSSAQYFTAADSASLSVTGNLTVDVWVNFETLPENTADTLSQVIGKWNAIGQQSWKITFYDTNGSIRFHQSPDGTEVNFTDVVDLGTFVTGTPYHIRVEYTAVADSVQFYLNGTSIATNIGTGATALSGGGLFGGDGLTYVGSDIAANNRYYLDGKIDELRVSNSIRSAGNFSVQTEDYETDANTMALYHFNDDLTTDSSGNSNTLTNANSIVQSSTVPYTGTTCSTGNPQFNWGLIMIPDIKLENYM